MNSMRIEYKSNWNLILNFLKSFSKLFFVSMIVKLFLLEILEVSNWRKKSKLESPSIVGKQKIVKNDVKS
jgi:hypothetical protein